MAYEPKPIDTSGVARPEDLVELTELLAENAHDHQAEQRMNDCWTYEPKRDNAAKKHPDPVLYDCLPESQKEYDRKVAMQTLEAVLALGFKIAKEQKVTSRRTWEGEASCPDGNTSRDI